MNGHGAGIVGDAAAVAVGVVGDKTAFGHGQVTAIYVDPTAADTSGIAGKGAPGDVQHSAGVNPAAVNHRRIQVKEVSMTVPVP